MIYLDHNATSPILPEVVEVMAACDREGYANPSSQHAPGRRARVRLEAARESIGRMLGARVLRHPSDRVLLTSGATESNHLAILGLARAAELAGRPRVAAVAGIEHPSGLGPAQLLAERGWNVLQLPATREGIVSPQQIAEALDQGAVVLSLMLGNHETGVIQPVASAAQLCHAAGAWLHTDATQALGKLAIDFQALGAASLAGSAHKLGGPRGAGLLLVRAEIPLEPIWRGGFQQAGLRPGTESVALAVGLESALAWWQSRRPAVTGSLAALRNQLETRIGRSWPETVVIGGQSDRLPQTSCLALVGLERQTLVLALDQAGIACSSGSACASGSSEPSPVLRAMNCPKPWIDSALRLSLGPETTAEQVDWAADRVLETCRRLATPGGSKIGAPASP